MNENWYRLDNVAKVFLAAHNKRNPRSIRVSCILTEPVDEAILKQALELTVKQRPQFQVRIRRGFFWHYLEQTDATPEVSKEESAPCPSLYGGAYKGVLHYLVTYYRDRINVDMFHAISDGNGAFLFLKLLVLNYLKLKHSGRFDEVSLGDTASSDDREQNSYDHFYDDSSGPIPHTILNKKKKAFRIPGRMLPYNQLRYYEVHMEAAGLLKQARELKVSLTSYIGAQLMLAISSDMPIRHRKDPVTISIPVNLRNYFPSETMRNFFNNVDVSHIFDGTETLEALCREFDLQLKSSLRPELIKKQMNRYQSIESFFLTRMVPLFIKQPVVRLFSWMENRTVTAVLSNLGHITMPENTGQYITGFTDFCSTDNLFITVTSYGNDLVLGITSAYSGTGTIRRLLSSLNIEDSNMYMYATEVIR
ncbi:MAG: hypothetical protein K6F34_04460 [Lachnospiraceae bacterium]|nr:hypothetical protein [Lachnospiraceae bacterium]